MVRHLLGKKGFGLLMAGVRKGKANHSQNLGEKPPLSEGGAQRTRSIALRIVKSRVQHILEPKKRRRAESRRRPLRIDCNCREERGGTREKGKQLGKEEKKKRILLSQLKSSLLWRAIRFGFRNVREGRQKHNGEGGRKKDQRKERISFLNQKKTGGRGDRARKR